jgi:hypothetical protein
MFAAARVCRSATATRRSTAGDWVAGPTGPRTAPGNYDTVQHGSWMNVNVMIAVRELTLRVQNSGGCPR